MTCGWSHHTKQWQALFPGILPATLTSSVTHVIPIMKDINQWMGGYEVTRRGFIRALEKRKVMFI
jgi:hypothetical protein